MNSAIDQPTKIKLINRLKASRMTPQKRKRLLGQVARKSRTDFRKNLRGQKTATGQKWAPPKDSKKKKLLKNFSKHLKATSTDSTAIIEMNTGGFGVSAKKHQDGFIENFNAQKAEKIHGRPDYDKPCTDKQARALKKEGYKIPRKRGKGYKFATIAEIKDRLKLGQAGLILRILRDEDSEKSSWSVKVPSRAFAEFTEGQIDEIFESVLNNTINAK